MHAPPFKEIPMNRDHDISVLNALTTTTLDSMKGYEDAAKEPRARSSRSYSPISRAIAARR